MEAVHRWKIALAVCLAAGLFCQAGNATAQNARTKNFLVHAPDQALAEAVARHAEKFRDDLANHWLGKRLPDWPTPCPIEVVAGPHLAAQGATTYTRSPVGNFQMRVIGTPERILDSVLPHEVTHTVMATHFGQPLPRWADEGICTTVEHAAEKNKHEIKLREYLSNRRGIAMNRLFLLTEYPNDMLPMYAQGYSVCRFLIEQSGPREFIAFLEDYMKNPSWTNNVRAHYGYDSLRQLQEQWLSWVAAGSGSVESFVSTRGTARPTPKVDVDPVASVASASWYQRRRDQSAVGQISPPRPTDQPTRLNAASGATAASATKPLGPPSVISSGYYSVAQPQAEQTYGEATMSSSGRTTRMYR